MVHYLSLSKKLGGFAAIAAFLLLLNGCGSSELSASTTCAQFMRAGVTERNELIAKLYVHGNTKAVETNLDLTEAEASCPHHPGKRLENMPPMASIADAETPASATESTAPAKANPYYPAVKFSLPAEGGSWPFQAQIYSLTESPNGFPGTFVVPERDQTILKVQVSITSLVSGRPVPFPQLNVDCSAVTAKWGEAGEHGWDQGEEDAPIVSGYDLSLGDGKPHLWDAEWAIGEGTTPSEVSCTLEVGPPYGTPSEKQVLNLG